MSGAGGGAGATGGQSTGSGGGGFTQSPNPFGGLNNTDLRPGRRRRRPVPLLDTSWVIKKGQRKQESTMNKAVTGLVDTLRASVLEINASGVDNREELLTKSLTEFGGALTKGIDDIYGPDPEPLEKGLNHISAFASALNRMNQTVEAIKTGRPSYMIDGDSSMPQEILPPELLEELDHFMGVGVFALRSMVNNSVELPTDDTALEMAEKAGQLAKIETDDGDLLVKTHLPDGLRGYITNPLDLVLDAADLGREMFKFAGERAAPLLEAEAIPIEVLTAYPDIFEIEGDLIKAFPPGGFPPKKKPAPGGSAPPAKPAAKTPATPAPGAAPGADPGDGTGTGPGDEALGGGAADDGSGVDPTDLSDDTPQDPLEILARLATIMVVITGSLLQGSGQGDGTDQTDTTGAGAVGGGAAAIPSVGLQRGEPLEMMPLAKMLGTGVDVDPMIADLSITDLVNEVVTLRKANPELAKQLGQKTSDLDTLKATVARLEATPMSPTGVARVVALGKGEDVAGGNTLETIASRLDTLRKNNPEGEGNDAARLLINAIHHTGGQPLIPTGR